MPITIYDQVVYGDTSGVLADHDRGQGQSILRNDPNSTTLIGDAHAIIAHAAGGDDTLSETTVNSTSILGDAANLSGHAHGGDDSVQADANDDLLIRGVTAAQLHAGDFLFA
jgi:hypothetical protein